MANKIGPTLRALLATAGAVGKELVAIAGTVNDRAINAWYLMSTHEDAKSHRARLLDEEGYESSNTTPKVFLGTFAAQLVKKMGRDCPFTAADIEFWATVSRRDITNQNSDYTAAQKRVWRGVETWAMQLRRWSNAGPAAMNKVDLASLETPFLASHAEKLKDCEDADQCQRALQKRISSARTDSPAKKEEKRKEALRKARNTKKRADNSVKAIIETLQNLGEAFETFNAPERATILENWDAIGRVMHKRHDRLGAEEVDKEAMG